MKKEVIVPVALFAVATIVLIGITIHLSNKMDEMERKFTEREAQITEQFAAFHFKLRQASTTDVNREPFRAKAPIGFKKQSVA